MTKPAELLQNANGESCTGDDFSSPEGKSNLRKGRDKSHAEVKCAEQPSDPMTNRFKKGMRDTMTRYDAAFLDDNYDPCYAPRNDLAPSKI